MASVSLNQKQDEIIEAISAFSDWFDIYDYLIKLGNNLKLNSAIKIETNLISGCQSNVWITSEMRTGKMHFQTYCDAAITRGLLSLLMTVVDGQPPQEIINAEFYFLEKTNLHSNLSPSRANGLTAIIQYVKDACDPKRLVT